MNRAPLVRFVRAGLLLMGGAAFLSCAETSLPAGPADGINAAAGGKSAGGPSVTGADPAYGHEGDVSKTVTITGSGFAAGAQAAWERNGVVDPKIQVLSTQYVSSTQLVATITIASDASIDLYDVSVTNADRKKGIGYALFEVTQAIVVDGTTTLHGANDSGDMPGAGSGTILFNPASGLQLVDATGAGWAVDGTGTAVVGGAIARLWNKVGAVWQTTVLPTDPSATMGRASVLSSDAVTGQVTLIGGLEVLSLPKHVTSQEPRLWIWQAATSDFGRILLPTGSTTRKGDVLGLSTNGVAVGWIGESVQAAVWESSGSGYTLTTLAPTGSRAMGINRAGTLIVGASGGVATYWLRLSGGGWSAPIALPGGCTLAAAVDDVGRIAANSCPDGNRNSPAVFVPPYSASTMIRLGGLGATNSGWAAGMSPSGNYIVGQANVPGGTTGVYWRIF
jgi:hypothetical protein